MSFRDLLPDERGHRFRRAVLRALATAYSENAQRFDPEDLGDNNTTFGVNVVHNLRHLVEIEIDGIQGIAARRAKNSFWLEIDGHPVYIYKAPPGQTTVEGMRFDESELRLQILEQNAYQLQFDLCGRPQAAAAPLPTPLLHPVITHFGGPEAGFTHASVGAPYKTKDGVCAWLWVEPFDDPESGRLPAADTSVPPMDDADDDFGLRLRDAESDTDKGRA